ncbi:crossover junction endonuclease MUS81 isoform X1 [Copidosoma floridanum]|uniref:crossover junction endonuclease MUS81 isoform X1 n=1 Tax=Copidosoma floridanum TaxID=29053 RepID=UPI0006C95A5E|nr:crossover junction endonuclease MUS81 isoform X1 [Copidosoma floridanum]
MIKANEDKNSANPLFEAWINEWRQEALARNSPAVHSFRKALASLKQYPLRLETGKDCHILQNFGHKLCGMIDKKLQQYKEVQNLPVINAVSLSHLNNGIETKSLSFGNLKNDKCSSSDFQPFRVESSLILKSQMLSTQVVNLKNTVIGDINGINDSEAYNFFKDKHATNYVKTRDNTSIERPGLVKSFNLSEDSNIFCEEIVEPDMKLATQVTLKTKDHQLNTDKCNDVKTASQKVKCSPAGNTNNEMFFWSKNFDIVLLVDIQETCGAKIKSQSCHIGTELNNIGISFETRSLKVGDFTWIARCRATSKELILPYIVERKRIDDLSASIIDGRYKEQKFRLKQTGVKNIIYLIESYGPNHGIIPVPSLLQASANLLIQDNFIVKFTRDRKDSMHYLARMTNIITKIYQV